MGKNDYSCPLPENKLVERFNSSFKKLIEGRSTTIISIPHLGHTSHLRYLKSNQKLLKKLGITNELFAFIDRDKVIGGYESFVSELLIELNIKKASSTAIYSQNAYVLNKEILDEIGRITTVKPIIIALVVEKKIKDFFDEIENILLLAQKSSKKFPVSILWVTDSKNAREYKNNHPSSTFLTDINYQKNFDKEETDYCLQRQSFLKGKKISKKILDNSLQLTGGFACTFHHFINTGEILTSEYVKNSLLSIKSEVSKNPNLVTTDGFNFLSNLDMSNIEFESINLKRNPTAQEINLIRFLQKNIEKPVSRDQLAEILWGKSWNTKYSDWAIDKSISRLRKNILSENYKIITVKNLGYQLIKL